MKLAYKLMYWSGLIFVSAVALFAVGLFAWTGWYVAVRSYWFMAPILWLADAFFIGFFVLMIGLLWGEHKGIGEEADFLFGLKEKE